MNGIELIAWWKLGATLKFIPWSFMASLTLLSTKTSSSYYNLKE